MNSKIVNFIQLYIEKIVLGICALILLIIILSLLFGNSYGVHMSGQMVPAADVPKKVKSKADKLKQKLQSSPDIKSEKVPSYVDPFRNQVSQPAISFSKQNLTPIGSSSLASNIGQTSYQSYQLPEVPVTTDPIAKAGYGTLALSNINPKSDNNKNKSQITSALLKLIGDKKKPYDFRYVTVAATFDLAKWQKSFDNIPGKQRTPSSWFTSNVAGVYLQRETWNAKDKKWSKPKIIKPLPTQLGFTDAKQDWSPEQKEDNANLIKNQQQKVTQPNFVPLAHGEIWQRPYITHALLTDRDQRHLKSLRNEIDRLKSQQDKLYTRISDINKRFSDASANATDNNKQQGSKGNSQQQKAISNIEKRLYQVQTQLYRNLYTRSNILMQPVPPAPKRPSSVKQSNKGNENEPSWLSTLKKQRKQNHPEDPQAKLEDDQIRVWSYDMTAKPGKKYRYRVIVSMVNPLFNKDTVATKQRKENHDKFALAPDAKDLEKAGKSSWVTVQTAPKYYFFFLSGSAKDKAAQIEIWTIYSGIWRDSKFKEKPGDKIGGIAEIKMENKDIKNVDMRMNDIMVDLISDENNNTSSSTGNLQFLYLDEQTNDVDQRTIQNDRTSIVRTGLENQQAIGKHQLKVFHGPNGKAMPYASPKQRKEAKKNKKTNNQE